MQTFPKGAHTLLNSVFEMECVYLIKIRIKGVFFCLTVHGESLEQDDLIPS